MGTRTTQEAVRFHKINSGLLKAGPQAGSKEESKAPIPHPHPQPIAFKQSNGSKHGRCNLAREKCLDRNFYLATIIRTFEPDIIY